MIKTALAVVVVCCDLVSNNSNNSSNNLGLSTVPRILAQFPLCISIKIDCLKNDVDLLSIVLSDINFPTFELLLIYDKNFIFIFSEL